jgi:two-component system, cell cycle sensor histidine kinase PleC
VQAMLAPSRYPADTSKAAGAAGRQPTGAEHRVTRQTLAIVDDRITNLKIFERLAQSLDPPVEVRIFDNPACALEAAARSPPDLVIADVERPPLGGAAFVRRLRAAPACAEVPIIVVTAPEERALRAAALSAGASDFLLMPIDYDEFRARARNLLTLRRQRLLLEQRAAARDRPVPAEEQRQRDALRHSHELLMQVIDAVPVQVSATDRAGGYVFVNDYYSRQIGRPIAEIVGLTPVAVHSTAEARAAQERDRRIVAGLDPPGSFEETIRLPAGEERVLLTTKVLLHDQLNRPSLVVTASVDITDRKEAELALIAAKEEAELASRSKTEFLANMSHELRTPLNAIIGFSQVMAEEMLGPLGDARYAGYARDIGTSAEQLLAIISDILDASKLEAGKVALDESAVMVDEMVRDVLHLVGERARTLEVALDVDIEADLPPLEADALKLKQALLNLVGNAIKFSHRGGAVCIGARQVADGMTIEVIDRGIGMDRAEIETARTRFGQVASTWSRRHPGTGLGLPLAIGLVELHGGRLLIDSQKGVGTTATIWLPARRLLRRDA